MYTPRRFADDSMAEGRVPLGARPTRAIEDDRAGLGASLRTRSVPVAVALAMTATAGAIVVAPQMSGSNQMQAAAPQAAAAINDVAKDAQADQSTSAPAASSSTTATKKATAAGMTASKTATATKKATSASKETSTSKSTKKSATTKVPDPSSKYTTSKSVLGLKPSAMVVYNAVMARWGGTIKSVGGYRPSSRSVHQCGRAIDFMLTPGKDSAVGWAISNYLVANAKTFDINHIIFEQKIWTPYRPYWRKMEDRGSITQNHYDHVHVAVGASRC